MSEHLKFMGRLAEKELRAKEMDLKIQGLRDSIRDLLDPFEDVADLRVNVVAQQALQMAELHIEYRSVLEEIRAIRKALGR